MTIPTTSYAIRSRLVNNVLEEMATSTEVQADLQCGKYSRWAVGRSAEELYRTILLVDRLGRIVKADDPYFIQPSIIASKDNPISTETADALLELINDRYSADQRKRSVLDGLLPCGWNSALSTILCAIAHDAGSPLRILRGYETSLVKHIHSWIAEPGLGPWAAVLSVQDVTGILWQANGFTCRTSSDLVLKWRNNKSVHGMHIRARATLLQLVRLTHSLPSWYQVAGEKIPFTLPMTEQRPNEENESNQ